MRAAAEGRWKRDGVTAQAPESRAGKRPAPSSPRGINPRICGAADHRGVNSSIATDSSYQGEAAKCGVGKRRAPPALKNQHEKAQHCTGLRPRPRPTTQPGRSLRGGGHGPILLPPLSCLQGLSQAEPTWKPEGKGVTDPMHYWARSQPPGPKAGGGGGEGRHSIGLTEGRQGTRGPCPPVQSPGQGGDMQWETPVLRSSQTGSSTAMF